MKAFQFSLENVLQYRYDIEDEKKSMYQGAQKKLELAKYRYDEISQEVERLNELIRESKCLNIMQLQQYYQYKSQLENNLKLQQQELSQKEVELNLAQDGLITAKKDVHILEKLKERKHESYNRAVLAEENKMLDEFSTMAYAAKA